MSYEDRMRARFYADDQSPTYQEKRLAKVQGAIAQMMDEFANGYSIRAYDLDCLAKIVDPSPMKRGRQAFIKKHKNWEDE
jgi:hypothetical protein